MVLMGYRKRIVLIILVHVSLMYLSLVLMKCPACRLAKIYVFCLGLALTYQLAELLRGANFGTIEVLAVVGLLTWLQES
jgi:hypothetical protein